MIIRLSSAVAKLQPDTVTQPVYHKAVSKEWSCGMKQANWKGVRMGYDKVFVNFRGFFRASSKKNPRQILVVCMFWGPTNPWGPLTTGSAESFTTPPASYEYLSLTVCSYFILRDVFDKIVQAKRGQDCTDTNQNYSFPLNRYTPSISQAGLIEIR
jgi:hypothetical protein